MKVVTLIFQEKRYRNRMVDALQRELPREWVVAGFDTIESLLDWSERRRVRVIIIEDAYPEEAELERLREYAEMTDTSLLWLTEEREELEYNQIFRYQPIDQVAVAVLEAGKRMDRKENIFGKRPAYACHFYGIWPVSGGSGATKTAYTLARRLAMNNKTLFLCLDPTPGLPEEITEGEGDVSELIYLLREYGENWVTREEQCTRGGGGFYYISGFAGLSDLSLLGEAEVDAFVQGTELLDYWNVVIDFGSVCGGNVELLRRCDTIYAVGDSSGRKWNSFKRQAEVEGIFHRVKSFEESEMAV